MDTSWLQGLAVMSAILFTVSILALPFFIIYLPVDFLEKMTSPKNNHTNNTSKTFRHKCLTLLGSAIGLILVFMGVLMLFLPGQGVITIILGLSLLHFPGKHQLLTWSLQKKGAQSVLQKINILRRRFNRPPLRSPQLQ